MPTSGNACARKGRSETWQFAKNKFWSDFVRKQTFRESRQVLLRKRMSRGFEFVLILQTTRGSNFGLLATEVYLTPFIILVFSTCVRSIRESLGETTPAGLIRKYLPTPGIILDRDVPTPVYDAEILSYLFHKINALHINPTHTNPSSGIPPFSLFHPHPS
ncbi:hypothetical protein AVEN_166747-1 [Araneus ventricosus]|uniref:Uncharacterized protein n=1 Tax=Araneus ventricosus TaxID=182803 RepID=A0A4Y2BNB9_ARAVE|nr:hypothetical protein AVEN_166747-1 [Araneus ventricosus]